MNLAWFLGNPQALDNWREKLPDDIYLIPVRLEQCPIPERLAKFQATDLFREDGRDRLPSAPGTGIDRLVQEQSPVRGEEPSYRVIPAQITESDPAGEIYRMEFSFPKIVPEEKSTAEVNLRLAGWVAEEMQNLRACRLWSDKEREWQKILFGRKFPRTQLSCRYSVTLFTAELLSVEFAIWFYGSGAAHGNRRFKTFNLLLNPPTSLHLGSFFKSQIDYPSAVAELCRCELLAQSGADPELVLRGTTPEHQHFESFTLTDSGFRLLFPPYQVGCLAWGHREVAIPFASVKGIINKDGALRSLV